MDLLLLIFSWFVPGLIGAAGLNADAQMTRGHGRRASEHREDLGEALLFGLLMGPLCFIMAFFMTGFFAHGLSLSPTYRRDRDEIMRERVAPALDDRGDTCEDEPTGDPKP
jgi:hypothetical protein